jgi:hypothetical protein
MASRKGFWKKSFAEKNFNGRSLPQKIAKTSLRWLTIEFKRLAG